MNTINFVQFYINIGSKYGAIIVIPVNDNFSNIGTKVLFEPTTGFGIS